MKTEKQKWVKPLVFGVILVAVLVTGLVLLNNKKVEINTLNKKYYDLNALYQERDSLVNDLASTFDEIEQNLTFVNNKRGQLLLDNQEGEVNQKDKVVADIKLMNSMLEESSKKIEELESKLKSSGVEIKSFKNKIAQLSKSIEEQNTLIAQMKTELEQRDYMLAERENQIAQMDDQLNELSTNLSQKQDTLKMKSETIVEKDNQLNTAYFASGTFKELKENGVLERNGGFLFLGRNETLKRNFNHDYFTRLDTRTTDMFPIFAKKVEIISEHPDSSYSYVYEDDQIAYLKIEDPEAFWKVTKYAVVEVK